VVLGLESTHSRLFHRNGAPAFERAFNRFGVVGPPCDFTTHLGRSSTATNSFIKIISPRSRHPTLFSLHHLVLHHTTPFRNPAKCHSILTTMTALDH